MITYLLQRNPFVRINGVCGVKAEITRNFLEVILMLLNTVRGVYSFKTPGPFVSAIFSENSTWHRNKTKLQKMVLIFLNHFR